MTPRYSIHAGLHNDGKSKLTRYYFKDRKATEDWRQSAQESFTYGVKLGAAFVFFNKSFLMIENAADAVTVCAYLNAQWEAEQKAKEGKQS